MSTTTISMSKVKNLLNYTIDNNIKLQDEGIMPIAVGLEAEAGIGKTSIVQQVAEERGMSYTKLVLSQLEEAGDLIGFPIKEYECQVAKKIKAEDGTVKMKLMPDTVWMNEQQLEKPTPGLAYRQTGRTRMNYAKPAWVPQYNENGNLLCLDDYSRANSQLLQSVMEIILTQGYISWKLPKKTTIVLTSNPDDGSYNVNSQDEAQTGRYMGFSVAFDINSWMEWAEKAKLDGRCINFVASYYSELFSADAQGNRICNPRSFVMFANMISGIKDWDNADNLAFITEIASGCFKDDGGRFSKMFASYIRNKMHLLIQPKEILTGGWDTLKDKLENTLYDSDGQYRPDIASLLERRFSNFVNAWLSSDEKTPIATVEKRIVELIETETKGGKKLFTKDMFYHMIKTITAQNKRQTGKLLYNPIIANALS